MSKYASLRAVAEIAKPRPNLSLWRVNVLLVDDDPGDTMLICRALRRNPHVGDIITRTHPGRALVEIAAGRLRPNVILLDIHMPRMDGFEFLEYMRRTPDMAEVPVVFLSSSALEQDVLKAGKTSAYRYITKPDSFDELVDRIGSVVQDSAAGIKRR